MYGVVLLCLLFVTMFSQPALSSTQTLRLKTKDLDINLYSASYALLVGVSNYEKWPDLPGVSKDILMVKDALEKQGFIVKILADPTRDQFDEAIRDFISRYGQDENNRLLFYFAGHGYTLTTKRGRELGYVIPADTPLPQDGIGPLKKKAIGMENFEYYAKQMEAKHALFLFDSCFSGSLFHVSRAIPPTISAKTSKPVRQFITAGSADQEVPDESVFRRQFIAGLDGAADLNNDRYITGTELASFLEDTVINYTHNAQTPQYGKIRDPYLDKGDFVFFNSDQPVPIKNSSAQQQSQVMEEELNYWNDVKNTNTAGSYLAYLERYPRGQFAGIARVKARQLNPYDTSGSVKPLSKKIVVAAYRNNGKQGRALVRYKKPLLKMMEDSLKSFVSDRGALSLIRSTANSQRLVAGISEDTTVGQDFCEREQADLLLTGWVRQNNDQQSLFEMSYYECQSGKSFSKQYRLDKNMEQARFNAMINNATSNFMVRHVARLFKPKQQPVVEAAQKPDAPAEKTRSQPKRIIPRW
ncbi:MAG: caspase family protein [Gammaproteobacteria bacterium]|jgi:hypothetical protein